MVDPADVPGLLPAEIGAELRRLAGRVQPEHAVVELGVYKARSTCFLGSGAREGLGARVWAIDPWDLPGQRPPSSRHRDFIVADTRLEAQRNVDRLGLSDRVTLVQGFSTDVAGTWGGPPVGLLYVDGDHKFKSVMADVKAWRGHLVGGAVIAFDDYCTRNEGVIRAVDRMTRDRLLEPPRIMHGRLAVSALR